MLHDRIGEWKAEIEWEKVASKAMALGVIAFVGRRIGMQ